MEAPRPRIKKPASPVRAFLRDRLERNKLPEFLRVYFAHQAFENRNGRKMNLRDPKTFQEKLLWYQLYYQHPDLPRIVDKYQFKQYIAEKLGPGHTVPLLGAWDSVEAFKRDWDKLPEEFCLKSTLQYAGNGVRVIRRRSEEAPEEVFDFAEHFLDPKNTLINSYFSAYYNATPRIIAEELVKPAPGLPLDRKVFCFSGQPYIISFPDHTWAKLDDFYGGDRSAVRHSPLHLQEMKALSETLSGEFPFVRVDFFDTPEKLYVAELTFNPGVGRMCCQPERFYMGLGDLMNLPQKVC